MRVPVFIYHGLHLRDEERAALPPAERRYSLHLIQFRGQLEWLSEHGITARSLESVTGDSVVLTFDDGHRSNYTHSWPLLERFGFQGTFFIVAGWLGRPERAGVAELREMRAAGMEIGSHGMTHALLATLPDAQVADELTRSKDVLEQALGEPVRCFAAPGGSVDSRIVRAAIAAGYEGVCTSEPGWHTGGAIVPRFSVTSHTPERRFEALAQGSRKEAALLGAAWRIRRAIKRVTGIAGYERLLERIYASRYRQTTCR